jgi:hypothetical protein
MSESKYIELAKKLKALSDRGVGGEKYNAEQQLKRLMNKHGLTVEDIEGEKKEFHYFKVPTDGSRLFGQVASTVLGKGFDLLRDRRKQKYLVIETTASDAIEIESKFDFYYNAFAKELDVFYSAFLVANDLYPKNGDVIDAGDLPKEELEKIKKIQKMAAGMDAQSFFKRLTAK